MKTNNFEQFVQEFNQTLKHNNLLKKDLNSEINLTLSFAKKYYHQELKEILNRKQIFDSLKKMEVMLSDKEKTIKKYSVLESLNLIQVIFTNNFKVHSKLISLAKALDCYFNLDKSDKYYWIIGAYLSEETHFNLIQLYHAIFGQLN